MTTHQIHSPGRHQCRRLLFVCMALLALSSVTASSEGSVSASAAAETALVEPVEILAPDVVAVATPAGLQEVPLPDDGVVVLFFFGTERCPDCFIIEETVRDLLEVDFEAARLDSSLHWQTVNYELPENSEFQLAYSLDATAIVLSRRTAGAEIDWMILGEVWDLVEDTMSLADYIRFELEDFLSETTD